MNLRKLLHTAVRIFCASSADSQQSCCSPLTCSPNPHKAEYDLTLAGCQPLHSTQTYAVEFPGGWQTHPHHPNLRS